MRFGVVKPRLTTMFLKVPSTQTLVEISPLRGLSVLRSALVFTNHNPRTSTKASMGNVAFRKGGDGFTSATTLQSISCPSQLTNQTATGFSESGYARTIHALDVVLIVVGCPRGARMPLLAHARSPPPSAHTDTARATRGRCTCHAVSGKKSALPFGLRRGESWTPRALVESLG